MVTLLLGAYCLLAAATALYAAPAPGQVDPAELAERERYRWPGWIPVVFLVLVVLYGAVIGARRQGRARGRSRIPSTQDPPPMELSERDRHRDSASR